MVSKIISACLQGIACTFVKVEVDVSTGLPIFDMVGNLGTKVREAKERIRVALKNSDINLNPMRITVNISPANLRKDDTSFDIPIMVGLLSSYNIVPDKNLNETMFVGELGLDGKIKHIKGVLNMALEAKEHKITNFVVPKENVMEASVVKGLNIIGIEDVKQLIDFLKCDSIDSFIKNIDDLFLEFNKNEMLNNYEDMCDVSGQENAKRALEIAAAGFHNVLMIGPPGSGKSMLANRLPSIMPPLSLDESVETSKVYSACGMLSNENYLVTKRPFNSPHHSASLCAMSGGGINPRPGIISLSHKGVLFLDEVVHFNPQVLELLRQPLEENNIKLARNNQIYTFPAEIMLVIAMNPCPCGYFPNVNKCSCSNNQIKNYIGKISGPILDRIDMSIEIPKIPIEKLKKGNMKSVDIRKRVINATEIQRERYCKESFRYNSNLSAGNIDIYIPLSTKEKDLSLNIYEKMNLSLRGYHRLLKVARTIADLEESKEVHEKHILEAATYRNVENKYFDF